MDQELLSLRSFALYNPVDATDADRSWSDAADFTLGTVHMVGLPMAFGFLFYCSRFLCDWDKPRAGSGAVSK